MFTDDTVCKTGSLQDCQQRWEIDMAFAIVPLNLELDFVNGNSDSMMTIRRLGEIKRMVRRYTNVGFFVCMSVCRICLQCFDAVGWAAGRASGL